MQTEEELRKNFKVTQYGDLISLIFNGTACNMEDNVFQTELIESDFLKIVDSNSKIVFKIIINLIGTEHNKYFAKESRQIFTRMAKNKQIGKVAVIGRTTFYKFLVNSLITATGLKKRYKWVSSQKEAEKWLNL